MIIVKGQKKYEVTCYGCNSILEFEKSDIQSRAVDCIDSDGYPDIKTERHIKCPSCNKELYVHHTY